MVFNTLIAIDNSEFINNTADFGGAVYATFGGSMPEIYTAIFTASVFSDNVSNIAASGLYIRRTGTNLELNVDIAGCEFINNSCNGGGALYVRGDTTYFSVTDSYFIGNTSV